MKISASITSAELVDMQISRTTFWAHLQEVMRSRSSKLPAFDLNLEVTGGNSDLNAPGDRLTHEQFKEAYVDRGFNGISLARRWGISPEWLSRLSTNNDRDAHWDDAARGINDQVDRMTVQQFKAELKVRGWKREDLVIRWGVSAAWVSRVTNDPDREMHWDDAARGLPNAKLIFS